MPISPITKQKKLIDSIFNKSKKTLGKSQQSYAEFSNFLTGAAKKINKAPFPTRSELEQFKTKSVAGSKQNGGGLLGNALSGIAAFAGGKGAAKGIKTVLGKRVGDEVAKEGTEKLTKATTEAVGKETVDRASKSVGKKSLERGASKMLGKKIPIIGAALGTAFAVERAMRGDWLGAAGELASGVASTIPGAGTAISLGIDGALIARDVQQESKMIPDKTTIPTKNATIAQQSDMKTQQKLDSTSTVSSGSSMVDINKFAMVVDKFGELIKTGVVPSGGGSGEHDEGSPTADEGGSNEAPPPGDPYTGPISGNQFFPLPGGILSNRAVGYPGGEYGAPRNYPGGHSGQDIGGHDAGAPVVAWKTGKVSFTGSVEAGDTIITIDHGQGIQSVYKHVVPTVSHGDTVYGGQQIASLFDCRAFDPHLHFEVWSNGSHKNPNPELSQSQKISSPMTAAKAKEEHDKSSTAQATASSTASASGLEYTGSTSAKSTVIGDSIASGIANQMGLSGKYSKVGANASAVMGFAQKAVAAGEVKGRNIILSSGISNDTNKMSDVKAILQYLKDQGASGVQLMGTSQDRQDLSKVNPKLSALAKEFPGFVQFTGGFKTTDTIHPDYVQQANNLRTKKQQAYDLEMQLRADMANSSNAAVVILNTVDPGGSAAKTLHSATKKVAEVQAFVQQTTSNAATAALGLLPRLW